MGCFSLISCFTQHQQPPMVPLLLREQNRGSHGGTLLFPRSSDAFLPSILVWLLLRGSATASHHHRPAMESKHLPSSLQRHTFGFLLLLRGRTASTSIAARRCDKSTRTAVPCIRTTVWERCSPLPWLSSILGVPMEDKLAVVWR